MLRIFKVAVVSFFVPFVLYWKADGGLPLTWVNFFFVAYSGEKVVLNTVQRLLQFGHLINSDKNLKTFVRNFFFDKQPTEIGFIRQ